MLMVFGIVSSLLIGISALAWLLTRHRRGADISILEWACRIVPLYCVLTPFVIWATHSLLVTLLVGTVLLGGIAASCGWRPFPGKGVIVFEFFDFSSNIVRFQSARWGRMDIDWIA